MRNLLVKALESPGRALPLLEIDLDDQEDNISLPTLALAIVKSVKEARQIDQDGDAKQDQNLPRQITFPYARHSSYHELCHLVGIFKPKDVYPCTENMSSWLEGKKHVWYLCEKC